MEKLRLLFPAGVHGVALLLARCSAASLLLGLSYRSALPPWLVWGGLALAAMLAFGLLTRVAAGAGAALVAWAAYGAGGDLGLCLAVATLQVAALSLLGAGAYSVDAHLFGRRVIHLDD